MNRILAGFITLSLIAGISCSQDSNSSREKSTNHIPKQMDDGWQTTTLQKVDIDSGMITKILDGIRDSTYQGIHSVLIVKDGFLVLEEYFTGYKFNYSAIRFRGKLTDFDSNTVHNLASVTKSVTALIVGIAFDKGFLDDVNDKAMDFFPGYKLSEDKKINQITLKHLLTMTSGLQWNEHEVLYSEKENDIIQLFNVSDPIRYILSKPVIHEPGTKWYYNGGGTNLLGEIIHVTTKLRVEDFADKYLFSPLQITGYQWKYINPGVVYASGDLKLKPRDMAKLGYIVLNDGVWNNNRIISSEWIQNMMKKQVSFSDTRGYGYQWWLRTYQLASFSIDSYYAAGWGGQNIFVFPSLNAVVVFTGGNYDQKDPVNEIIHRYLLPALIPNYDKISQASEKIEFDQIQIEAPITESIDIVQPDNNLRHPLRALSGHWYGRWDYAAASQLVIEKIDKSNAVIVYSYSNKPAMRKEVKVIPTGKIEFSIGSATLTFEMDGREDVLIGYYREGQAVSKIVMKRK